jgi:hypothetical protein
VVRVNKPLPCLYQHEPQPGQLTNYVLDILLFVEENLLEPPYRVGVYLSQLPSMAVQAHGKAGCSVRDKYAAQVPTTVTIGQRGPELTS